MSDEAADIHTLSGAYALDALEPAQAAAFERHLQSCGPCRDELRTFNAAVAAMADDAAAGPPARLRNSVLAAISEARPLPPLLPAESSDDELAIVVPLESRRARRATTWLVIAAAVLSVAMTGAVWRSVGLQSQVSELATAAADLNAVLTAPDAQTVAGTAGAGSRATVVMSKSQGRAVLVTEGMPPPPTGSTYQVWYVGAGGSASSAGFVPPTANAATVLTGNPATAVAIGVTLEPEGGSPQPTTPPLMVMELPTTA